MARKTKLSAILTRFLADESGATAIEYALMASGIGGNCVQQGGGDHAADHPAHR